MMKKSKHTLTPKLRFPEFRDMPGWETVALGKLLLRRPEYGINAPAVAFSEQLPTYLRITDIDDDGCFISKGKVSVGVEVSEENYLSDGDIVLARTGASVGKSYRYRASDGRLVFAGFLIRVRPDGNKLVPTLLANYLTTWQYWEWVRATSARSGQPGINGSEYASLPVPIPLSDVEDDGVAEQQKIAECLSSLDGLISAEGRKLAGLRDHKRGLMQQLFPQPGQTQPRLRFPEFRDKPEWTNEKLGRICKFVRGPFGGALKKEIFVPVGYAVYEQSHAIHKDLNTFRYYIDEIKYNELQRFAVKPNDIIMSCSGTMGKFAILSSKPTPGVINQALLKLSVNKKYDLSFIAIALELPGNQSKLLAQSAGGAIKNVVGVKLLKEIEISVPAKQEQSRIADCLTALDTQVNAQAAKIESLKQHKRGLMQQLFPAPEEQ